MEEEFRFSEFSTFERDGKVKGIEDLEKDLQKTNKANITFSEKLNIGDEVKLKGIDYTVIIEHINFEIPGLGRVDYAGKKKGEIRKELKVFNQKDVEGKVNEREYDEEER